MPKPKYVIGVDFGSDSVRALVVDVQTGEELGSSAAPYKRWAQGRYSDAPNYQFRQHPLDYLEGLEECVTDALNKLPPSGRKKVIGIGVDTTGSTPGPVNENGTPLALLPEFKDNPHAMFILWKDHTAVQEAFEINDLAKTWGGVDYTKYSGGVYSPEWFWAKILHSLRMDENVRNSAYSWVECCDWIPALLTGTENPKLLKRSRCAAGHKAMWHADWGGLPSEEFLVQLDPLLTGLRERLYTATYTSDQQAGKLTKEWADRLGLPVGIPVAVGALDAHMGAVGGGIKEKALVKIMGTSTCDMMVAPHDVVGNNLIEGICGQVDGSIIPGMIGFEAGQSAFGDVFAWFKKVLSWPLEALGDDVGLPSEVGGKLESRILEKLTNEAAAIDPTETTVLALDWFNGRRTPWADPELKGALIGLTLGTNAPRLFRALVEATAFGSKATAEEFKRQGLAVEEVIAQGGIPEKNPFVMQVTADVLNMPINTVRSNQAVALGAAMFASVASGVYSNIHEAQAAMGSGYKQVYKPNPSNVARYQVLYTKYLEAGEKLGSLLRNL